MKGLKTLIKLHKNNLDKTLKQVKYHETEKRRIETKKKHLEEEAKQEIEKYSSSQYAYMLNQYLQNIRNITKRLDAQILQTNSAIEKLQLMIREEYSELKKFEIALENRQKEEALKQRKIEEKLVDEYNINKFSLDTKKQ